MVLETLTLFGVLFASYNSWHKQDKELNQRILKKQQQLTKVNKAEKDLKPASVNSPTLATFTCPTIAMIFAVGGGLFYPPVALFSIPFLLYAGRSQFIAAWHLIRHGRVDIETLTAGAITGTLITGHFVLASLFSFLFTASVYLTSRVIQKSRSQLFDIFSKLPEHVWLVRDEVEIHTSFSEIREGDVLAVRAGEVIPADGYIVRGMAGIDQHHLTGESVPIEKGEGDTVFAATGVLSGKIYIRIHKTGAESSAMKIAEIVQHTAEYKSLTALRSETFSRQMVTPALVASAAALPLLGFSKAVAILVLHPKERLSVSAPISLLRHLKQASAQGILIKDGRSLELLNQVDTLVFDKTGTLTEEQPHVGHVHSFSHYSEDDILRFSAIAEYKQTHPLARAISAEAQRRKLTISAPDLSEYQLGYGIKVLFEQQCIRVGSVRFMQLEGVVVPEAGKMLQESVHDRGYSTVMVGLDNRVIGAVELHSTLRLEAKSVIQQITRLGRIKDTYIISGDGEAPTRHLARTLGIEHYFAQTLPHQKAALIKQLQQRGAFVCYVGDGINDAIAMKQAQVSVSLAGASHVATDTAQIILLDRGLSHLPRMFELASGFHRHMNNQLAMILGGTVWGVSAVFLAGWGLSSVMALNICTLSASLSYSLLDNKIGDKGEKN